MERRHLTTIMYLAMVIAALPWGNLAFAGAGVGSSTNSAGTPIQIPTYYANSPAGTWTDWTGAIHNSGMALRKFVDGLPGVPGLTSYNAGTGYTNGANDLGQYMPLGVPDKNAYPGSDYYEIAIVEYAEKMHSDLPNPTALRAYVQLETPANAGVSKHVALNYPDGSPILDANGVQVYGIDNPHYLGPIINATRGTPVRIKYTNYLPTGHFNATTGQRNGDLFIPVDKTLMSSGAGPLDANGNPCDNTVTPNNCAVYTENREVIHLHGGDTPWISDGTPSQWTVPRGEVTPFKVGPSYENVPDMPIPGEGSGTLYYNNGESARLMFYHDHVLGITRLNVYAGLAAGYLLNDQPGVGENALVSAGALPSDQIPLVIQEKTFVPQDIAQQDAKWDTTHWGKYGDLWFPHVYETNQDPNSFDGTNPVGRWDWGPWFWPIFPAPDPLPTGVYGDASTTPEAFGDTPVINGTLYPTVTVDPKAYRFRLLNASNDRFINLGLYIAADKTTVNPADPINSPAIALCDGSNPSIPVTNCTEVKMVNFSPGAIFPAGPNFPGGTFPSTGGLQGTGWGTPDARVGGVPDPSTMGPDIIQIGSEGGILPQPAIIPSTPVNYEYNKRSVTVLNVLEHGLYVGPAERADFVVDFSAFAGKTLILYNDSPAPVPAGDPRLDYYTGNPDQTAVGGAASTLPGYGPNTRTMMQIVVRNTAPAAAFDASPTGPLATNLPAAYAATQPKPVVAESAYNSAFLTNYGDTYAKIYTGSINQHTFDFTAGDTLTYYPEGSTTPVTVTEGQLAQIPVLNKAIQELFDSHGRMNATLGVELPFTGSNIQTTIPLGYADPTTETIKDGETQIWKITHNGVDTHPVHFHLVNVQVINRVGWDGTVKPPYANEVGWKETVKMNPLEDIIVAVRANAPSLPFGLPVSIRPESPSIPLGSSMGFTQIDPLTGNPPATPITNVVANFGWEYVWHCHILGHEENDFMRPFVFQFPAVVSSAPTNLTSTGVSSTQNDLSWTDPTPIDYLNSATFGSKANEIGFRIERASTNSGFAPIGYALANHTTYSDTTAVAGTQYWYRIIAYNAAGDSAPSNVAPAASLITVTPLSTAFGSIAVNYTSPSVGYTISNPGALPLNVSAITLGGTDSALFALQNGSCGTTPFTLAPGTSCNIAATFTPTSAGSKSANIQVTSDALVAASAINLTGTGVNGSTLPVRINLAPPVYYSTLAAAFTAAKSGNTIQAWGVQFIEPTVTLNTTGTITFGGGYDPLFGTSTGMTALKGALSVTKGTLVVGNLTIM
ncbi:laccase [Geotalea uraniireducens]|uniref:Laccase n=1 Tax=Geotalea uraniireducens TaxID=351604 RepID=A0ABM8EME3_9BACT|nr:choice-of-anchor D domain-containing protein [Geotalea uraniireducens]BDV43759.1 laccase [Geotalea uraniireducens]